MPFKINDYKYFRRNRNRYGRDILLYKNEEIPFKILNQPTASSTNEIIATTKHKWPLLDIYKPTKQDNSEFLEIMNILLDDYTETYENIITLGDFNLTVENPQLNGFIQLHDMSHLINKPTCFKSCDSSCIGNILTNGKISETFEMKSGSFRGGHPRKKIYRSYKNFDFKCFNTALKTYNEFVEAFCSVLNLYAPLTVKMLRHNNGAFATKGLGKAIMKQSRLKKLLKNKEMTRTRSTARCNLITVLIY